MEKQYGAGAFASRTFRTSRLGFIPVLFGLGMVLIMTNAACNQAPSAIAKGTQVSINYTLTVDGKVFDTSTGKGPLTYLAGSGQIIPGLDEALIGLKKGDKKQVTIPPEKGYGPIEPKAVQKVPRASFGNTKGLKVGMVVTGQQGGRPIQAKVVKMDSKDVTLDMNHPLAGKTLVFDIEVMDIQKAKAPAPPTQGQQ